VHSVDVLTVPSAHLSPGGDAYLPRANGNPLLLDEEPT